MFELIAFGVAIGSAIIGYFGARRFVRDRLRYVDAIQGRLIPIAAAIGAAAIAAPIVWLVPFIGGGTALIFGASVGMGVSSGARAIRHADHRLGSGA